MARILVIEDNPENLDLMAYLLEAFGHEVQLARDGEAGLAGLRRGPVDLVVCDLQLPGLSGLEVLQEIKRDPARASLPVIAVTALAMVGDRDRTLEHGFDGYIAKPIDPRTFVPQLLAFLGQPAKAEPPPALPSTRTIAEAHPPAVPRPSASAVGRTVLVVDDMYPNRLLLRCLLEARGFIVLEAEGVAEALTILQTQPVDLVLSDVHMPSGRGHSLLTAMRNDAVLRATPLVFVSSTVWRAEDRRSALELGAVQFLMRPIEPEVLFSTLEQVLADRAR